MSEEIVNKIANSSLINIDLEDFYPSGNRMTIDLSQWLYEGIILREKDFREQLNAHDWTQYQDAFVAIHCSTDAIIPQWSYMLIASKLHPYCKSSMVGTLENLNSTLMEKNISKVDFSQYDEKKVIIKGCGSVPIPSQAYLSFTSKLQPYAQSIMFGEACSTVPIHKRKKK